MSVTCKCGTYRRYGDEMAGRLTAPAMHLDACMNCGYVPPNPTTRREAPIPQQELLGDKVAKTMDKLGVTAVTERLHKATGFDCGCKRRQEALNNIHRKLQGS